DFVKKVRQYGWHNTSVSADKDGPAFSYTTGFPLLTDVPEFMIFGLASETRHDILWDIYRDAEGGGCFVAGTRTPDILVNLDTFVMPVAKRHYREYLGWSRWFYGGDDFHCLQLIWPDRAGLFPWEEGFAREFAGAQPDLTENGWRAHLV